MIHIQQKPNLFFIFFVYACILSFFYTNQATPLEINTIDSATIILNNSYEKTLSIIQIAQQISLLIHNNQVKVPAHKQELLNVLQIIQGILGAILEEQVIASNLNDEEIKLVCITNIINISYEFIKLLEFLLDTKFKKMPHFDLNTLLKRNTLIEPSLSECQKKYTLLCKKISNTQTKSNYAGLSWYNITTRNFEKYILDPAFKYNIDKIGKYGSLATVFIALMLWIKSSDHLYKKIATITSSKLPQDPYSHDAIHDAYIFLMNNDLICKIMGNLQKHFGVPMSKGNGGSFDLTIESCPIQLFLENQAALKKQIIPIRDLCVLIDGCISDLGLGRIPTAMIIGSFLASEYKQLWIQEISQWIHQKKEILWNFLRGGAYTQNHVSGVWDMQPSIRFKDVVGMDEVKEQLSFVIKFIENPEQYIRVNAAPSRGYLLTGPTRTGKTYIVDAFCGEIQQMLEKNGRKDEMKFWRINSEIIGAHGLQKVLNFAKENAPIVLFIDEIDLHGLQRVTNNRMLEQFLTALGSTLDNNPRKQVILITATNKPETLDKALRQPDRLGKEIRFEYPSLKSREHFLRIHLENMGIDIAPFDLHTLAQKTSGKSFADLRSMLNNAIMKSWIQAKKLSQILLEESIDSEIRHIIFEDRKQLTEKELLIIATHLAGKALVCLLNKNRFTFDKATIKAVMPELQEELPYEELMKRDEREVQQKIKYGDIFRYVSYDTIHIGSYEEKINEIKFLIAGSIAEEIILGGTSYEYRHEDIQKAYSYAQDLAFEGLNPKLIGENEFNILSEKAYTLLSECKEWTRALITSHKEVVEKISQLLLTQKMINAHDIYSIIAEQTKK